MKNIINVSIAGIAFKLDEEAYNLLDSYLDKIRSAYGNSPEGEEILSDIEARIAEIILTKQDMSETVHLAVIEEITQRLGSPEDISGGSAPKEKTSEEKTRPSSERSIPHRLYRNPEDSKLGGVCSGLAAYFNTDPVVVRLLFAAPLILLVFFSIIHVHWLTSMMTGLMTTSFFLYFLLWIVIPKAKTPLQKLEMKGEKFTKDKIEQTFREEFQSRSNDPHNIQLRARNERNASIFSEFISIIGKILLFFAKALVAVIGFSFIIAIAAILIALIAVVFNGADAIQGLNASSPALVVTIVGVAVLLPLALIVYGILKFLFGFSHNKPLVTTVMVIWVLTLVFGTIIIGKDIENISFGDHFNVSWNWESSKTREKYSQWEGDDIDTVKEMKEIRYETDGKDQRASLWRGMSIPGDTLFIASLDSVRMPDNFTLKIKQNEKYREPSMMIRKYFRADNSQKVKKPDTGYFEQISVEQQMRGDTLFLRVHIPDLPHASRERAEMELFLPGNITVFVGNEINYNEYFRK